MERVCLSSSLDPLNAYELRKLGIELYASRLDKGYSLTDCISMMVMKQMGIYEILTHDKHFTQEGLTILF
jgi:predicted nucleic acid-binding protein